MGTEVRSLAVLILRALRSLRLNVLFRGAWRQNIFVNFVLYYVVSRFLTQSEEVHCVAAYHFVLFLIRYAREVLIDHFQ